MLELLLVPEYFKFETFKKVLDRLTPKQFERLLAFRDRKEKTFLYKAYKTGNQDLIELFEKHFYSESYREVATDGTSCLFLAKLSKFAN